MKSERDVLKALLPPSTFKILKLFINNDDQTYYLREIAKLTKVPPASTFRILNNLVEQEVLMIDYIKKFKLYRLNPEAPRFLANILQDRKSAVVEFVNSIKAFDGVEMVVLHGQEDKNRANILVIGNNMDNESIKRNSVFIGEKYKFNIILLTLVPDQYNQMASMGLYPGKKKILYESKHI